MTTHRLELNAQTLHGAFSPARPPVLTIDSGDTVVFRTLDAGWNIGPRTSVVHDEQPPKFEPRPIGEETGHALCGPIAVRGAEPGMALAVRIDAMRPGAWGYTGVGGWPHPVNDYLGVAQVGTYLLWELDADRLRGRNQFGHTVRLAPFLGVMGMPPAEPGLHSTVPPRPTGGNLDCKELVVGSTLYLPIAVPLGLFSAGDGHARQGDGESSVTAIECPLDHVALTFFLEPNLRLAMPRAETPAGLVTFGLHADLDQAAYQALDGMVTLLQERYGLERLTALGLASVLVDLRITQIVNQVSGVHAVLAHEDIAEAGLKPVAV